MVVQYSIHRVIHSLCGEMPQALLRQRITPSRLRSNRQTGRLELLALQCDDHLPGAAEVPMFTRKNALSCPQRQQSVCNRH